MYRLATQKREAVSECQIKLYIPVEEKVIDH